MPLLAQLICDSPTPPAAARRSRNPGRRSIAIAVVIYLLLVASRCAADPAACSQRFTISSRILGQDRTILVSLPASYGQGTQRYPVLYITDAEWQFDQAWSSAAFLARNGIIPEIIVVGVTNIDRVHDLYATRADFKEGGRTNPLPTSGSADQFLQFLQKELIPWTESKYRASSLRILAGHSAGGNFALHAMRAKPGLFQAIIAASPWMAWDDFKELKLLEPFLEGPDVKAQVLFFSSANESAEVKQSVDALNAALRSRKDTGLRWNYVYYPDETHDSTVVKSYFDGMRMVFAGWSFPRDPQTDLLVGSLDDMKAHYASFGEQFGYVQLPPEGLVSELGYQFLKSKALDQAFAAFRYNTEKYPQSANVWDSLADALEQAGKIDEALSSCRKAVSLAEKNGDPNLDSYRKHAARLLALTKTPEK